MENIANHIISAESIKLLNELRVHKVQFAHMKSNSHLYKALSGETDIDLLIDPDDQALFCLCMENLAFKRLISPPWSSYPMVEDWISLDKDTGKLIHLHTHFVLVTRIKYVNHLYLPWEKEFFKHLKKDKQTGWPIPKPELEAIILFISIWAKLPLKSRKIKNPSIPSYKKKELIFLLNQSEISNLKEITKDLNLSIPESIELIISKILNEKDSKEIMKLSKYFYYQLKPYNRNSWTISVAQHFYFKYKIKGLQMVSRYLGPFVLKKRLAYGGKTIAIIGSDGSGKSTLCKDLIEWLTYKIDTHYLYMGKKPFIKSYNTIKLSKINFIFNNNFFSKRIRRTLGNWRHVLLVQSKLKLLKIGKKLAHKGSIIICDRFPQNNVFGINDGPGIENVNSWAGNLERRIFNEITEYEPDLVIRLLIDPQVAKSRKPEHDSENIRKKCEVMHHISYINSRVVDIDANLPYQQVLLKVKKEIWEVV